MGEAVRGRSFDATFAQLGTARYSGCRTPGCKTARGSSHIWTTSTYEESWKRTVFCKKSCGLMHASGFTTVRLNSRTGVEPAGVRSSPLQLVCWNLTLWCGRVILSCHCPMMGCVFWELQSAHPLDQLVSSCYFRESPQWRTSKQRGCCCSVEQHAPISGCA